MMDETIMNTVENTEAVNTETAEATANDDAMKQAIEDQLNKIARQNMLIGAQTMCRIILDKVTAAMAKPGKRTMNDYKRIIKDIDKFCSTCLSRKVNADGETDVVADETQDENNTKLMEED